MHQQTQQGLDFSIFQKRRLMILQDHQKRRQQLFNKLRNIQESEEPKEQLSDTVSVSEESSPFMVDQIEENPKPMNKDNRRKLHIKIAKLMQQPEWLNFVPEQFNQFYGTVRPRGKKALLVIDGNMASFYDKNGHQLHRVPTLTTNYAGIVLEVYLISKQVSFVSDVLSWKANNELGEQSFEFRMAWLCSNLPSLKIPHLSLHRHEYYPITRDNLIHMYKNDFGYDKEGLMFVQEKSLRATLLIFIYLNQSYKSNEIEISFQVLLLLIYPLQQPFRCTAKIPKAYDISSQSRPLTTHTAFIMIDGKIVRFTTPTPKAQICIVASSTHPTVIAPTTISKNTKAHLLLLKRNIIQNLQLLSIHV